MSVYLTTEFSTPISDVANFSTMGSPGVSGISIEVLNVLNKYYVMVLIVFGLFGNGISAVVFSGTQLRSRSSSYYLAALAISDAVFLLNLLLIYLESDYVGLEIYTKHDVPCKFFNYLSYVTTFLSVWLIVSFTIERFIAVQYPLQRPRMCTVKRAKLIVLGLAICAFVIYTFIFMTAGLYTIFDGTTDQTQCGILAEYQKAMRILNILDMVLTCILPVMLIVIMNTMIAVQLYKFSRTYTPPVHVYHEQMRLKNRDESEQNPSASSLLQPCGSAGIEQTSNPEKEDKVVVIHYIRQGNKTSLREEGSAYRTHSRSSSSSKVLSQKLQFNITKMLLVISTVFIGLNLPSYVIRIYITYQQTAYHDQPIIIDYDLHLAEQYLMLLFYTHFSINFLLYSIYGVAFRRALLSFMCDKLRCRCFGQTQHVTFMYKCMHVIHARRT